MFDKGIRFSQNAKASILLAATGLGLGLSSPGLDAAFFENWETTGYIGAEVRAFAKKALDERQSGRASASLILETEFYREWQDGDLSFTATPYLRLDTSDPDRSHFDLREFYLQKIGGDWELQVGVGKVFWGVAESRHLVDIINQTDQVENIDGEEKLGQPMVNLSLRRSWGTLDVFLLPYFRERTFPGPEGRLRSQPEVDTDRPIYESSAEEWHTDFAIRYSQYFGDIDVGLSYFYGTGRDPVFVPETLSNGSTVLRPGYFQIQQIGLDLQYTTGPWLWKFEGIARSGKMQHFQAFTGGFEYTFYGVFGTDADLGTLAEYQYDSRGDRADTPFNHDIFSGARLALNDENDTSFLGGIVYDPDNGATSLRAEFERRINGKYKLIIEGQTFNNSTSKDPTYSLRNDSFLQIEIRRYF